MNAATKAEAAVLKPTGLALLREPVPEYLISQLPKGTKAQNECPANEKITCNVCGGWHHPKVRHLSYVGHAAATHLLLDADPKWNWEPMAYTADGLPRFDDSGGLWIRLTVCEVTRVGYGHADKKAHMDAGSREKEVIGDALRNAGLRFGLALELWSKADIHGGTERQRWFESCVAGIRDASNVGELKTRVAAAIDEARQRGDQEAEDDFLILQADKMVLAKRPPPAPTQSPTPAARRSPTPAPPPALDDDDLPF